jgi:hypothetical protein
MNFLIKQILISTLLMLIVSIMTSYNHENKTPAFFETLNTPSITSAIPLPKAASTEQYISKHKSDIKQAFLLRPSSPLFRWITVLAILILQAVTTLFIISKLRALYGYRVIAKSSYYFLRLNVLASQAHPPTKTFFLT